MRGSKTLLIVLVSVGVLILLAVLGMFGLWLWFDYDMRNPQKPGWMD